MVYHNVGMGAK